MIRKAIFPLRGTERWRTAAMLAALMLVAACSDSTGPDPGGPEVQRDLLVNHQQWEELGIHDYTFTFTRSCYCLPDVMRPAEVVVRGDAIESVTYLDDGQPVDPQYIPIYQTIDELFEMIADAVRQDAAVLEVTYHPDLHYPTNGYIDISEQIADEEQGFTVTDLEPLPEAVQQN